MAVGTRFAGGQRYRPPVARRIGIQLFARVVSLIVRQRVTDTTSGFRAVNRRGSFSSHRTTLTTIQRWRRPSSCTSTGCGWWRCRSRCARAPTGRSSITLFQSIYYMLKVSLALFVGLFRRRRHELEDR